MPTAAAPRSRVATVNGGVPGNGAAGTMPKSKAPTALPAAANARRPSRVIATARDGPGSAGRATTMLVVTSSSATSFVPVASSATRAWAHAAPRSATRAAMASARRTGRGSLLAAPVLPPAPGGPALLALQLALVDQPGRVQIAGGDRRPHRAAGLGVMAAVGEPAAGGELLDVGEGGGHARGIDAHARQAQARRVDEQPAAVRQGEELAARGRVAPAVVARADLRGGLALVAQQRVDQGRLAHARGADQRARAPAAEL